MACYDWGRRARSVEESPLARIVFRDDYAGVALQLNISDPAELDRLLIQPMKHATRIETPLEYQGLGEVTFVDEGATQTIWLFYPLGVFKGEKGYYQADLSGLRDCYRDAFRRIESMDHGESAVGLSHRFLSNPHPVAGTGWRGWAAIDGADFVAKYDANQGNAWEIHDRSRSFLPGCNAYGEPCSPGAW